MAHGRVSHELLHILLHQRYQCAVDDRNQRKRNHPSANFGVRENIGEKRQRETNEAVSSHLQQNARQDNGTGGWSFHVRIRQPGVERKHRHFDRKGEKEREKQQRGNRWPVRRIRVNLRRSFVERRQAEGVNPSQHVVMEIEEQDAQQHQHGTGQRIEEELDRGVKFTWTAPDADQQIHRYQHGFPENEEQEEVERNKNPQHAGLQNQKPNVIFFYAVLDGRSGRKNRDPAQQRGQHDEQERNAVDADHVTRANRGNPVVRRTLNKLEAGFEALHPEPGHQRQRDQKSAKRKNIGNPADGVLVLLRDEQEHKLAHQRREDDY